MAARAPMAPVFFGIATRRAVRDYLLVTALCMLLLLAIAWTIDLARFSIAIRRYATEQELPLFQVIAPYLYQRATDILVRLMPVACFAGVFVAELLRRLRLETVVLETAGWSPLRLIAPFVIYGAVLGGCLFVLEDRLRPHGIAAQVKTGLGVYGSRFAPRWTGEESWFLYGDIAVQGEVFRDSPPAMRDVKVFYGLTETSLRQVIAAERLDPTDAPGQWRLRGVTRWDVDGTEGLGRAAPDETVALPLLPEELMYHRVAGFYLPRAPLQALRAAHPGSAVQISAEVAHWRRSVIWLTPFVLGLLAAALARFCFSGRLLNIGKAIALGAAGYIGVISLKIFFAIGELGGLSAAAATLGPHLILLAVAGALILRSATRASG